MFQNQATFEKEAAANTTRPEATRGGTTIPLITCPVLSDTETVKLSALSGVGGGRIVPDIERMVNLPLRIKVLSSDWRSVTCDTTPYPPRTHIPTPLRRVNSKRPLDMFVPSSISNMIDLIALDMYSFTLFFTYSFYFSLHYHLLILVVKDQKNIILLIFNITFSKKIII